MAVGICKIYAMYGFMLFDDEREIISDQYVPTIAGNVVNIHRNNKMSNAFELTDNIVFVNVYFMFRLYQMVTAQLDVHPMNVPLHCIIIYVHVNCVVVLDITEMAIK